MQNISRAFVALFVCRLPHVAQHRNTPCAAKAGNAIHATGARGYQRVEPLPRSVTGTSTPRWHCATGAR